MICSLQVCLRCLLWDDAIVSYCASNRLLSHFKNPISSCSPSHQRHQSLNWRLRTNLFINPSYFNNNRKLTWAKRRHGIMKNKKKETITSHKDWTSSSLAAGGIYPLNVYYNKNVYPNASFQHKLASTTIKQNAPLFCFSFRSWQRSKDQQSTDWEETPPWDCASSFLFHG